MENQKAIKQHRKATDDCKNLINQIKNKIELIAETDYDEIHFGHVGSANYVKNELQEILNFLNN